MAITCIIEGCGNRQEEQGEGKNILFRQLPADETIFKFNSNPFNLIPFLRE
jgi:hypothetical protein